MSDPAPTPVPHVLVVADDPAARTQICGTLNGAGFQVAEAGDCHDAIAAFQRHPPDVVLLTSTGGPGLTPAACRGIRSLPDGEYVPIVVLRGHAEPAPPASPATRPIALSGVTDWQGDSRDEKFWHRLHVLIDQKRMGDRLRHQEAHMATVQRISGVGGWEWDVATDVLLWSREAFRVLGVERDGFEGSPEAFLALVQDADADRVAGIIQRATRRGRVLRMDVQTRDADRHARVVHLSTALEPQSPTRASRLVGTIQDVTRARETEHRARFLASHDPLTALPNRRQFRARLVRELGGEHRHGMTVLYIGLGRFTRVNDSFGQETGDAVLKEAATRIRWALREAVGKPLEAPIIARIGGDEFAALIPAAQWYSDPAPVQPPPMRATPAPSVPGPDAAHDDTHDGVHPSAPHSPGSLRPQPPATANLIAIDPEHVAGVILERMADSFRVGGSELFLTTSVGISQYPVDGKDADALMCSADVAHRHAKRLGTNARVRFRPGMQGDARRRLTLESHLRRAVERDELRLHYQPKVDVRSGEVVGMEALARWTHPELGTVPPAEFIRVAEDSGLIGMVGEWVLHAACTQTRAWQRQGLRPVRVSVNLSPHQFRADDLVAQVARVLQSTGLDAGYLELEITEGTSMHDPEATTHTLNQLHQLGVWISIDDFGTGYSSLAYLQRFPLNALKVDRSFVQGSTSDADSAVITRTIIALAKNLNLHVVAEGVETAAQFAFIREHGCDQMQGYLFSPALEGLEFAALLAEGRRLDPNQPEIRRRAIRTH